MLVNIINGKTTAVRTINGEHVLKGGRASGRTTAQALMCIGSALANPGEPVVISDHHNSRGAHEGLECKIRSILAATGLLGFTFKQQSIYRDMGDHRLVQTLIFDPLVPLSELVDAYKGKA